MDELQINITMAAVAEIRAWVDHTMRQAGVWQIVDVAPPAAALPDTDDGSGQTSPINPADIVVDILRSQPLSRPDRERIGRELDSANERADGNKASTGEAFGRITGRVPSGMATLTGRQ